MYRYDAVLGYYGWTGLYDEPDDMAAMRKRSTSTNCPADIISTFVPVGDAPRMRFHTAAAGE